MQVAENLLPGALVGGLHGVDRGLQATPGLGLLRPGAVRRGQAPELRGGDAPGGERLDELRRERGRTLRAHAGLVLGALHAEPVGVPVGTEMLDLGAERHELRPGHIGPSATWWR